MIRYSHFFFYFFPAIISAVTANAQHIVWLEAEAFENPGGWVNDPQFTDVMGSPYLLANGVDEPVEDASTLADIPVNGHYRLWVRCKDWLPEHSPGTFQVFIGSEPSYVTFGQSNDSQWKWIDGGFFDLKQGKTEIRLHDLTGWWGRCDAVVLSNMNGFVPSDNLYHLELQRMRYFDPYRTAKTMDKHDVVVVGGGLAGSAAAIQAARLGCSVVLIQDRPVLGGNASSEIQVNPGGDNSNEPLDPMETGIIEDFYSGPGRGFDFDWSAGMEKAVRNEIGIDLRLNTRAINVIMKDEKTITAVVAVDVNTGERMIFPGTTFVDCTGDGWIGFWAGAEFRKGSEAQTEFNESLAPETADDHTMGNTLMVAQFREDDDKPFVCPGWVPERWKSIEDFETAGTHFGLEQTEYPIPSGEMGLALRFTHGAGVPDKYVASEREVPESAEAAPMRMMPEIPDHFKHYERGKGYRPHNRDGAFFQWWAEHGGMADTIYDAETTRDELFLIDLGMWNYVKNHDPKFKEQNKNRTLTYINHVPGKRESRRLTGDYILTQWDYADRIIHDDNVAYGGWGIDTHHPNGFWKAGPMYYSAYQGHKVSIPFRSLYSKTIDNLLMAGRNISVSHVALGGVRVMRTTCLMGQAAGCGAAVCVEKGVTAREAGQRYIHDIQQRLMKEGAYIMGQKNDDPDDLALTATVTASSMKTISDPKQVFPNSNTPLVHDLNMQRAVMFKPDNNRIEKIHLFLRSNSAAATNVTLTLRQAKEFGDFSSTEDLVAATASVPPKSMGWVAFDLGQDVDPGQFYYVFLPPTQGLQWDLYPTLKKETCRAYGGPSWTLRQECYKFSLSAEADDNEKIPSIILQAENVIDGFNRAVNGVPHSWGPDPNAATPHWIELKFDRPREFNIVHISFQNYELSCPDYRIEIRDGDSWKTIDQKQAGRRRRQVHYFDRVCSDRMRLVLEAPALGDARDTPQVCEIRVYDERDQ